MRVNLRQTIFLCGIVLICSTKAAGQTCRGKCGDILEECSCHATCASLLNCCADYNQSCILVTPHSSSMLGGRALRILSLVLHPNGRLLCRFKGEIVREGFIDAEGHAHCISPLLYETGWIPFDVSTDGINFDRSGEYLSVHPSKADPAFEVALVNATQWQYYRTSNTAGRLKMTWNSSLIGADKVNIELWGYREFNGSTEAGMNGSSSLRAELSYLYSLGRDLVNTGAFSFTPECSKDYSDWELGNIRITASSKSDGASPMLGSGQKCCYDSTGALVLTGDSTGGSTPDRAHDWGSPPYREPPRVPGYSHWLYDVMSFYYCCLWSDHCHIYLSQRPSSGCRNYQPPKAGVVFGDPHFITFDSLSYTFNGKGEYYLLSSPDRELSVQARTERLKLKNSTLARATRLSSVAMREKTSDVIEVRLAEDRLQVLRNQKVLPLTEQRWMDLHRAFVFVPSPQNVTVMFLSGVGVEVRVHEGVMAVTVLLPSEFTNHTRGLLGRMNSDPSDDILTKQGEVISTADATPEQIFTFGAGWNISKTFSLFTYDSKYLLDTYGFPQSHDAAFVPAFSLPPETPDDPLVADMLTTCRGDGAQFCKFDTLTTRSLAVGNATLRAYQNLQALMEALQPVVSCGWLPTPSNGKKNGTNYLKGDALSFSCSDGYILYGSTQRTCLDDGTWTGEQPYCITEDKVGFVLGAVGSLSALVTMGVMIKLHNRKQDRFVSVSPDLCNYLEKNLSNVTINIPEGVTHPEPN
ncbi:sushi domain-containing protein 2 [Seriola aureovittata]|uniref:sushi domain-containing protein 2 n=1 Tax=Seriola aureovittata TaxID=2871759 RepID=UPI0024BF037F|nr:sushi domain-containing protein 2 [Seriola aureovittata]